MKTKLTEITDTAARTALTGAVNKGIASIVASSNKQIKDINKYFADLYKKQVDGTSGGSATIKRVIDTIIKHVKEVGEQAARLASSNSLYTFHTFKVNNIDAILCTHKLISTVTKTIDNASIRVNGKPVTAIFDDKTRAPLRLEHKGVAYAALVGSGAALKELEKSDDDNDEVLAHEIGYVKTNLANVNTFKGFKDLESIGTTFYNIEKKVNTDMKCKKLNDKLEKDKANDISSLIMGGINLIGVNSLAEAKLLGVLIEKDKNKDLSIKVLKKVFGQA